MIDNVISLPRPRAMRPGPESLGLYLRAGRNDHKELLNMLASGGTTCFGVVVEAVHAERHRELREEALRRDLDVVLDPKTQAMAFPGAHTEVMAQLPWGLDRHHRIEDFRGAEATSRITALADFVLEHGFTQVLAPTHLLQGANDPWLGRDVAAAGVLREALAGSREQIPIIYSLALPIQALRDPVQRRLIIRALRDAPMDALWLKVENFGSDASPAKARAYIEAASDFHSLGVPIIADHAGGLVGLALLAFSAVSGMAHGVTLLERFNAGHWRRERTGGGARSMQRRVYVRSLDLMLKPAQARMLLEASPRARSLFGCRDTHCCPRGIRDMLEKPARHFLCQRMQEVSGLSRIPTSLRVQRYLEEHLRPASDRAAAAAGLNWTDNALVHKLHEQRTRLDNFRLAMAHHAEASPPRSFAAVPERRVVHREHRG